MIIVLVSATGDTDCSWSSAQQVSLVQQTFWCYGHGETPSDLDCWCPLLGSFHLGVFSIVLVALWVVTSL